MARASLGRLVPTRDRRQSEDSHLAQILFLILADIGPKRSSNDRGAFKRIAFGAINPECERFASCIPQRGRLSIWVVVTERTEPTIVCWVEH